MANAYDLSGITKWLDRDRWREPFHETMNQHLGPPCASRGIAMGDLPSAIGDQAVGILWACMVEDFLAFELDDGSNIVDDYLKRRGWRESVATRRYLAGLRSSVMSLYEVSDIVRERSFLARDLLRGGEPLRISERSGTRTLKQGDRLAARIVQVGERVQMAGGALRFNHERSEVVLGNFTKLREAMRAKAGKLARKEPGNMEADAPAFDRELLRCSASLFTHLWLDDILKGTRDNGLPRMCNSDGDEITFVTVRYPLKHVEDRHRLESALTAIPSLHRADKSLWTWNGPAILGDSAVSMGQVELEANALKLETNSPQRAQKGRALLEPVIGPFVREPVVESSTVAEIMTHRPPAEAPPPSLPPEEERAILHATLERHYRQVLDEPVPMLGNVTPRKAARTRKGREKLVAWLQLLEDSTAQHGAGSPMAGYDIGWMWHELGIADLRP